MQSNSNRLARRELLATTGGAMALVGGAGLGAAGREDSHRVNVGYAADSGRRAAVSAADDVVRVLDGIDVVTALMSRQAAGALADRPDVRYVERDSRVYALGQTEPWGVDRVDPLRDCDAGHTGDGADVAILDTGIDPEHPDLQANVGPGMAAVYCADDDCYYTWDDDHGHGTHCAGIAAAVDNTEGVVGVADEATLHAVKVLDYRGDGYASDVAAGLRHVADYNWDVASMSLGGLRSDCLADAVADAKSSGVFLVAAAGNDGPCSDCVKYPAAYPEVMAVSSTDRYDDLSDFSSTGPEIEIAAPGSDVYSTYPDGRYETKSGTSMACPHVAGAAGILMVDGYDAAGARTRLKNTAEHIGMPSEEQGSGLLDLGEALGPRAFTDDATNVSSWEATLNGHLEDIGEFSSVDVYFYWHRVTGSDPWNKTSTQTLTSNASFSADVSYLDSDTAYNFYAVLETDTGLCDQGEVVRFRTDAGPSPI